MTTRLMGVLEAQQTEKKTIRNDRLIAVTKPAHDYGDLESLQAVNNNLLKELEDFFIHHNATEGRKFELLRTCGPKKAKALLKRALHRGKRTSADE